MQRRSYLVTCALILATSFPTFANDLHPPNYRSSPRSTHATWDFLTETNPKAIPPDANVRLGDAADALHAKFPNGVGYPAAATFDNVTYEPNLGGGYAGAADGGGGLVFIIPNWFESNSIESTRLRLQVTYQGPQPPTAAFGYDGIPGDSQAIAEVRHVRVPLIDASEPAGSGYFYEDWEFIKSPIWEQVVVYVPEETVLLQVIIDTGITTMSIFDNQYEGAELPPWK